MSPSVHVCQAGSCRRNGSEAVLLEIEELTNALDGECKVKGSGCLGLCSRGPAAVSVTEGREQRSHVNLDSLEASANVVETATGTKPRLDDPGLLTRLSGVRAMRMREQAISQYRWNGALNSILDEVQDKAKRGKSSGDLERLLAEVLVKSGFKNPPFDTMPSKIEDYTQWTLEDVTKLTRHSAVFHFKSNDRKRGTPNPRGGGRSPPKPKTWHTTLLGEVGKNEEGPLPWVERDYTPISGALEWERGTCDILIKIYKDGAATSWLHRVLTTWEASGRPEAGLKVWLSKPVLTLSVPYLVSGDAASFSPASVLLLLAGTGIVAMPQVLHHRDPYGKIGISVPKRHQLHVPVDMVFSCRADDVLMLDEITERCKEASEYANNEPKPPQINKGLRNCTLLLTDAKASAENSPFPNVTCSANDLNDLKSLPNAEVLESRLSLEIVRGALAKMPEPCRVVVSGPSAFNQAARNMLLEERVSDEAITILEA
ncbi:hypothetical protein TrST_g7627 [Triparma strigata]|uniref:FAD-binding FR-type domain-containing protein n=1 Tax=Triparma strigata TaxID=1606541 RepID=A0A9W7AQF0_9STRA|nr:hypothetical protein TrST_g7627 [Triparma strigata]